MLLGPPQSASAVLNSQLLLLTAPAQSVAAACFILVSCRCMYKPNQLLMIAPAQPLLLLVPAQSAAAACTRQVRPLLLAAYRSGYCCLHQPGQPLLLFALDRAGCCYIHQTCQVAASCISQVRHCCLIRKYQGRSHPDQIHNESKQWKTN
jgi:hypothetical protein